MTGDVFWNCQRMKLVAKFCKIPPIMTDSPTPARANSELLALVSTRARSEQHHQYMHQIQDYYISIGIQSVLSA